MYKKVKLLKHIRMIAVMAVLTVIMLLCSGREFYADSVIAAPRQMELYNPKVDTVYLRWNTVTGAEKYYVYMSTSKTSGYELVCGLTVNKLLLKGLQDNVTYYFKVYAYGNGKMSEASNIVSGKKNVKGIDVSKWNEIIDWNQVYNSGLVDFAIIRCGFGSNYLDQDDIKFVYNMQECSRLGIPMGVYLYSYATNTAEAQSEADHVLRMIAGHTFPYKVWYDLEDSGTTGTLGAGTIGDIAETFCNSISRAGFEVGIYANKYWFTTILTDPRFDQWPKWVAQYSDVCTYDGVYIMWQYTSKGSIPGIVGNVDVNYAFTGVYADFTNAVTYDVSNGLQHKLPEPGNVRTTIINKNKVVITWDGTAETEKYIIYRSNYPDSGFQKIAETTKTAYTDEKIPSGVSYYYRVQACNSKDSSVYSSAAGAKLYANQPSDVNVEVTDYNKIKLTWTASSDATGYEIYRAQTSAGSFVKIATTSDNFYVNNNITTGQRYYYKIRAIRTVGNNEYVYSLFTGVVNAKAVLNKPLNVKADAAGYNTVKVTYSPVAGATGYEIYRSISKNGTYRLIKTTTATTFYNTNLTTGFTYFYRVKAIRKQSALTSKSEFSEKVWKSPKLGTVYNLKAASNAYRTAELSWAGVNGASGYDVFRCSKANGTYTRAGRVKTNSFSEQNRPSGNSYYYKVRAYRYVNGKIKYGAWSAPKKITIK